MWAAKPNRSGKNTFADMRFSNWVSQSMAMRRASESGASACRRRAFVRRSISRLLSRTDADEPVALEGMGAYELAEIREHPERLKVICNGVSKTKNQDTLCQCRVSAEKCSRGFIESTFTCRTLLKAFLLSSRTQLSLMTFKSQLAFWRAFGLVGN